MLSSLVVAAQTQSDGWQVRGWQDIGALATAAAVIVALGALVYAHFQLREARLASRRHVLQAERIQEAQSRPYVVIDFDFSFNGFVQFEITNLGQSAARDVTFTFDPPLLAAMDKENGEPIADRSVWRGIPSLAPGRRIFVLFDNWTRFEESSERFPTRFTARVSYAGDISTQRYVEEFVLDMFALQPGELVRKGVPDVIKELKKIREALSGFAGERKPLRVVTEDREVRAQRREAEWKAHEERHRDSSDAQGDEIREEPGNASD